MVSHRKIILPQLGAPGTSAHEVKKRSGFQAVYGPVRASDLPEFLKNGMSVFDRLQLVPMEIMVSLKYLVFVLLLFFLIAFFAGKVQAGIRALDALKRIHSGDIIMQTSKCPEQYEIRLRRIFRPDDEQKLLLGALKIPLPEKLSFDLKTRCSPDL